MRLRSLHIKGFKSFANETVLNFDEDVIGVVGPNGSGKSNIVDAVRWVLGEQKSRELRLEAMTDVIFNGTKTRKKSSVAQVTLTFDNTKNILPTEFQSVSISRLLYRSGESEYRLNNMTCRLKDIKSLFIDTGIGSNSYAIIALGMVDDILEDKDRARRRMFEQAAGISKYKTRKRETLNKLKNTTADLDRVEDLLFEIESNLKTLEKQAKRTKKYFEIKETYKELSVQFALRSVASLKTQYKEHELKLTTAEDEYRTLDSALNIAEAELEEIKTRNLNQEQNLSDSQRKLNALVGEIRSAENDKSLAQQKLEFKENDINKLVLDLERVEEELILINKSIESLKLKLDSEENKARNISKQAEEARINYDQKKTSFLKVKSELDAYAHKKQSLNDKIFEAEKRIAVLQNVIDNSQRELSVNAHREEELIKERSRLNESFKLSELAVEKSESKLKIKEEALEEQRVTIDSYEDLLRDKKDNLARSYRKRDAYQNEHDLLKSMVDSFEGFPASVKYLSNNWKKNVPILSDLLEVEEAYKSVIEQFLEPYLNHYVVGDLHEANEAIHILQKAQKGKASFILLNEFKKVKKKELRKISESIPALSVIKVDKEYEKVLRHLLADVFIYLGDNSDISHLDNYEELTFLSGNGSFIKESKFIRGGSIGLFEGKRIGRKKNLEKLEKKLKKEEKVILSQTAEIEKLTNKIKDSRSELTEANLNDLRNELKHQREDYLQKKIQLQNIAKDSNQLLSSQEEIRSRLEGAKNQIAEQELNRSDAKNELGNLSNGQLFSDEEINDLDHQVSESREAFNQLNIQSIRQQNHVENLQKDLNVLRQKGEGLATRKTNNSSQILENKRITVELTEKIHALKESLDQLYGKRELMKETLNEVEKLYYNARTIIGDKEHEIRRQNRQLNQTQVQINKMKDDFNDIKFKLTGVGERLKIEFDIILNEIINDDFDESLPYEEVEEKVERLRKRIQNFGEINPMAVTAYDEMNERYETISKQREDILEAKDSLLATIKEIEDTATIQFMDSFNNVRENFIQVFRSLFTEDDTCDLILLDPENPLESDIEIVAKPKGKKPRSLSQLSGGEKTLTATALLFSLYLLKPAPFCIFDEVDAPLDDANIQKFNRIINQFSGDSQFIIVTHNKSTMAAVDVLYGVYMQEQGVSGVTPVDFRNYEHQPLMEVVNN